MKKYHNSTSDMKQNVTLNFIGRKHFQVNLRYTCRQAHPIKSAKRCRVSSKFSLNMFLFKTKSAHTKEFAPIIMHYKGATCKLSGQFSPSHLVLLVLPSVGTRGVMESGNLFNYQWLFSSHRYRPSWPTVLHNLKVSQWNIICHLSF